MIRIYYFNNDWFLIYKNIYYVVWQIEAMVARFACWIEDTLVNNFTFKFVLYNIVSSEVVADLKLIDCMGR